MPHDRNIYICQSLNSLGHTSPTLQLYCLRTCPHQETVVLLSLVLDGPAAFPLLHPHPADHQLAVVPTSLRTTQRLGAGGRVLVARL